MVEVLTTNSPFLRYLNNPPWIKDISFRVSVHFKAGRIPGHVDREEWGSITYTGALQPTGFVLEPITFPPKGFGPPAMTGMRTVAGLSDSYYWSAYWGGDSLVAERALTLSSTHSDLGGSDKNVGQIAVQAFIKSIEKQRFLGFPNLRTNSIKLRGSSFQARTADGDILIGNVLSVSNDLPLFLRYHGEADSAAITTIHYRYAPNNPVPDYFEITSRATKGETQTNWIEKVEFGVEPSLTKGYAPSMFFTNLDTFDTVIIYSNGNRYQLKSKVGMVALPDGPMPELPHSIISRKMTLGILIFAAVIGWLLLRQVVKREKPKL
ncbi:MAG TPA: hypothetical protein VFM25_07665 [Verrucomicrobiae bacterium]|nr:hypothetical protein [Verrucomicrobiae bacterium]